MVRNWTTCFILAWMAFPAAAGESAPAIVARVKSINAVVENFQLLAGIAGREEAAGQIEALIKAQVGKQGLAGIDMTKPVGAYARIGEKPDDVTGVLLIPVADEKAFLGMVEGLYKIKAEPGDIFVLKTKTPFDGYLRFAKGYAHITAFNKAALDEKNLLDPAKILAMEGGLTASVLVRLDQLPKQAKQLAIAHIEQELQKAQESQAPGETAKQKEFRVACLQEITRQIDVALRDGKDLTFNLALTKTVFNFTVTLEGKSQSELAKAVEKIGGQTSLFANLQGKNAAFTGATHLTLPGPVHQALIKLAEEAIDQARNSVQDPVKKKQAEAFLEVLAPTLKASDLDIFATVASEPNGQYSVLAAIKVKEGAKLGKTVEGLIGQALHDVPEASKNQIKLKFDTVNGVAIHRFELPADKIQGKTPSELFGAPFLYVVFRGDAVVVGVGKEGLAMVKAAMIAKEGKMPMMVYDFQLARFADLLPAPFPDHARKIFQQEGDCRFRLTIEGGKELRLRVESQPAALQFLLLMNQRKGGLGN